jgi:hypothetical protein
MIRVFPHFSIQLDIVTNVSFYNPRFSKCYAM